MLACLDPELFAPGPDSICPSCLVWLGMVAQQSMQRHRGGDGFPCSGIESTFFPVPSALLCVVLRREPYAWNEKSPHAARADYKKASCGGKSVNGTGLSLLVLLAVLNKEWRWTDDFDHTCLFKKIQMEFQITILNRTQHLCVCQYFFPKRHTFWTAG